MSICSNGYCKFDSYTTTKLNKIMTKIIEKNVAEIIVIILIVAILIMKWWNQQK